MSNHVSWLKDNSTYLVTTNAVKVKLLDFIHERDETILKSWAKHFREYYCTDEDLDSARTPMGLTRSQYLEQIKFPDLGSLGSATRSGDFAEILVADYLNYALSYYVPHTRYDDKKNRNTSQQGVDIVGFKIVNPDTVNPDDELITCEVKAALRVPNNQTFQNAIDGSKKDYFLRTPEALNAIRQRLKARGEIEAVRVIERFQNKTDRPYKSISGAAVVHSNSTWSDEIVTTTTIEHPNENLFLIAVKGEELLDLANSLYKRACDEA